VAIGAAAHGYTDGERWWNTPRPERYIARIGAGRSPVAGRERPDGDAAALDRFALALRTRAGAPLADADPDAVGELAAAGLLDVVGDRVVLRPSGRLLATEATRRLRPAPGRADGRIGTRYIGVPG
jgi:oxygen-independent coproporphyrinogen-3 oxidase